MGRVSAIHPNPASISYLHLAFASSNSDCYSKLDSHYNSQALCLSEPNAKFSMLPVHVPAGWKTYRVDTYNYQISYPPTFFLNGGGNELSIGSVDPTTYQHPGIDQANIGIGVLLYPDKSSLAVWREGF